MGSCSRRSLGALIIVGCVMAGLVFARGAVGEKQETQRSRTQTDDNTSYTCAMHPQVRAPRPGTCPICGMELVPNETRPGNETESETGGPQSWSLGRPIPTEPDEIRGFCFEYVHGRLATVFSQSVPSVEITVETLVTLRGQKAVPQLRRLLQPDKLREVGNLRAVGAAAEALGRLHDTQSLPALLKLIDSPEIALPDLRYGQEVPGSLVDAHFGVLRGLYLLGSDRARTELEALQETPWAARTYGILALRDEPLARRILRNAYRTASREYVRLQAALALIEIGQEECLASVLQAVANAQKKVRVAALKGLLQLDVAEKPRVREQVRSFFADEQRPESERIRAAGVLVKMGEPEALDFIVKNCTSSQGHWTLERAVSALGWVGKLEHLAVLRKVATERITLRTRAVWAMAKIIERHDRAQEHDRNLKQ